MLEPEYLLHISEGAEDIAGKLHSDILMRIVKRIMLRIGRGEEYILTAQDKWQIENLQQAGYLLEDIQKDIAEITKLQQKEIAEAMEEAGVQALEYDDKVYRAAGLSPTPLTKSPEFMRLMQRNYEVTLGEWTNFTRITAGEAQKIFINQLDKAYMLVSTGALSYTQAVKEIIDSVTSDGVKVIYPTGHTDTIETATLRAVRTGVSQATAQIQIARMGEMDVDLVIVSSHLGARPSHQEWQGKIYSRSGKKYPHFVEATGYGSISGLCGVNCRHSFGPYFEGMDNPYEQYDSEENRKQYEKEQYQRALERRIRNTKREVMGKKAAVEACQDEKLKFELDMEYQKKSALLAKQNAAYGDYCERNNLKPLSDRIQVAKWDRQQAAAARGAAKRYENANIDKMKNPAKASDVFLLGDDMQKNEVITPEALLKNLETSEIGKEAIEYIERTGVKPKLVYEKQWHTNRGDQRGNVINIYMTNIANDLVAAQTVIHEITHHKYDIGGCQWAEAVCMAKEKMHKEGRSYLTPNEKRYIVKLAKRAYPEYNWKKGGYKNGKRF